MKSVDFSSINLNMNDSITATMDPLLMTIDSPITTTYRINDIMCRLCARAKLEWHTRCKNIEDKTIMAMFAKCFPNVSLDIDDSYPKKICADCLSKLKMFAIFTDKVSTVQNEFHRKLARNTFTTHYPPIIPEKESTQKPLFIKQEPVVNVKQEIVESNKNYATIAPTITITSNSTNNQQLIGNELPDESDRFCECCDAYFINNFELKSHIVNFHSDNPREVANNCEIMEIITLEDAFIDLDENAENEHCMNHQEIIENSVPIERQLKVEYDYYDEANIQYHSQIEEPFELEIAEQLIDNIYHDHCYNRLLNDFENADDGTKNVLKEEQEPSGVTQIVPYRNDIELNEHEQVPLAFETIPTIYDISDYRTDHSVTILPQIPLTPQGRVCELCSFNCKSIYQYVAHKNRYHKNGSAKIKKSNLKSLVCTDCSNVFHSKLSLNNHKRYICAVRRGLSFKCKYCQIDFSKWIQMRAHTKLCQIRIELCQMTTECTNKENNFNNNWPIPPKQTERISESLLHVVNQQYEHTIQLDNQAKKKLERKLDKDVKQLSNGRFGCALCNRSYSRRSNLVSSSNKIYIK